MPAYRQTCQILQLPIHKVGFLPLVTMVETVMIWASRAEHFG